MKRFNNTDVFTGYIKQLLKDFNLPKVKIYTKEHEKYFTQNNAERYDILETTTVNPDGSYPANLRYITYLKDDKFQQFINGEWITVGSRSHIPNRHIHKYNYGDKVLNYTKNLNLYSNVYDSYTHEYLGDYLRFQRDYNDFNLMPLYNCFSNRACSKLKITGKCLSVDPEGNTEITITNNGVVEIVQASYTPFSFDTSDANYKIYMLPVKLFKSYTIAIDCTTPIELCCGLYGKYQDTREKFKSIPELTYKKIACSYFNNPFLYTGINNLNTTTLHSPGAELLDVAQNEGDLKLFIKLPADNNSTIIVLEGNYLNWNDTTYKRLNTKTIPISHYNNGHPSQVLGEASKALCEAKIQYLDTTTATIYTCVEQPHVVEPEGRTTAKFSNYKWVSKPVWSSLSHEEYRALNTKALISENRATWIVDNTVPAENETYLYSLPAEQWAYKYITGNTSLKVYPKRSAYFNPNWTDTETLPNYPYRVVINLISHSEKHFNKSVINLDQISTEPEIDLITTLQLLQVNTKEQHPFADRLMEYLLDNAISKNQEELPENIKQVQYLLKLNSDINNFNTPFPGYWTPKMNAILYEYMTTHLKTFETNHDVLGYVDKDVEKYYAKFQNYYDPTTNKLTRQDVISLLNLDSRQWEEE